MSDSVSDLLAKVSAYQQGSSAATQQVVALTNQQSSLANDNASVLNQVATDSSTVEAAQQAAALKTQAARVKAANIFGANLDAVNEEISTQAANATAAQQAKDDALKTIQQKSSVSILDDPLSWIVNRFTINDDIAKYNAADNQLSSANERIQSLNLNTQAAIKTQNEISEPITAASAAAAARNAAAKATIDANNQSIAGLGYNINGITATLNASKESLALQFQAQAARDTQTNIGIALQHLDLSKQSFEFQKQEWAQKQDDIQAQQAIGKQVISSINAGRQARMGDKYTPLDDSSGKVIMSAIKGNSPLSQEYQIDYANGQSTQTTGVASLGNTPAAAYKTLSTVASNLPQVQDPVKAVLGQAVKEVNAAIANPAQAVASKDADLQGLNPKDQATIDAAINAKFKTLMDKYSSNINGDPNNPLTMPSINVLAANSPVIQSLPVYTKVLKPLLDRGVALDTPDKVFTAVSNAVINKQITMPEALEATTINQIGAKIKLQALNLPGFGYAPYPGYNTPLTTNKSAFDSSQVYDITKPDQYARALSISLASKMYGRVGEQGDIGMLFADPVKGTYKPNPNTPNIPLPSKEQLQFGPTSKYPGNPAPPPGLDMFPNDK